MVATQPAITGAETQSAGSSISTLSSATASSNSGKADNVPSDTLTALTQTVWGAPPDLNAAMAPPYAQSPFGLLPNYYNGAMFPSWGGFPQMMPPSHPYGVPAVPWMMGGGMPSMMPPFDNRTQMAPYAFPLAQRQLGMGIAPGANVPGLQPGLGLYSPMHQQMFQQQQQQLQLQQHQHQLLYQQHLQNTRGFVPPPAGAAPPSFQSPTASLSPMDLQMSRPSHQLADGSASAPSLALSNSAGAVASDSLKRRADPLLPSLDAEREVLSPGKQQKTTTTAQTKAMNLESSASSPVSHTATQPNLASLQSPADRAVPSSTGQGQPVHFTTHPNGLVTASLMPPSHADRVPTVQTPRARIVAYSPTGRPLNVSETTVVDLRPPMQAIPALSLRNVGDPPGNCFASTSTHSVLYCQWHGVL